MTQAAPRPHETGEIARYVANGLVATGVHFAVLTAGLELLHIPSAGLANLLAAGCGITASFLGSRYFVFRRQDEPLLGQAARFGLLYATVACGHALLLFLWADVARLDYRLGFLVATGLQVATSYWGNKFLVFRQTVPEGEP